MLTLIRNFFDINHELVLFIYGQVFFVLGLAIALQSRRHSRLELAESLPWLSWFGILHSLHEWGFLLIPIQASYVRPAVLALLLVIQTVLLGCSFAALAQFGANMLRSHYPRLRWVPASLLVLWLILLFGRARSSLGTGLWQQEASVWARYLLGLPGALLAAWGLRHQAARYIKPLNLRRIYNMLRVAGLALVAYALFGGLLVPYADFFPANWLNQSLLVEWVGVPVPVFRSVIGLVLAATIIRAMEVFDVEIDQVIEQMQVEQSLAAERERIGRELHDGAIQRVYTAGLIVESARRLVETEGVLAQRLDRALTALNEAIAGLRAYMGDLRPQPTTLSLEEGLRELTADPRLETLMDIALELRLPADLRLNPVQVSHVLALVGEALSNAARHAQTRRVAVRAYANGSTLVFEVEDSGRGFDHEEATDGYGLRNMRDRARLLGGSLTIDSAPNQGTRVTLNLPCEEI